ncbi:hypothetical protein ACP275_10G073600 [Erythranthe tilingii]
MSSSCLRGGGGRAYRLESLDLDIIKSPSSTTSWISNSSSPSSTLSESSNCPLAISTRKPRTPRKRPNQTYNEAAAILSTAYPKIFPTKANPCKFTKSHGGNEKNPFLFEPSDLLMPFRVMDDGSGYLLHPPGPNFCGEPPPKGFNLVEKVCRSPGEINSQGNSTSEICDDYREDFDAESILDEEIGAGIDSIMGNSGSEIELNEGFNTCNNNIQMNGFCYGYPVGLGFEFGNGLRRELRPMRNVDEEGDWWRFPSVNVLDLAPANAKPPATEKKKKKKVEKCVEIKHAEPAVEDSISNPNPAGEDDSAPKPNAGLLLKLNYDTVLNAWCDKGSPFSGDSPAADSAAGSDVQARLAQIDLFSENGGIREASVLRYKEKRRTRLFSKKIRYQVRKVNADRRPRMKGRFVRTPNSSED